jgi:hypothetical protein
MPEDDLPLEIVVRVSLESGDALNVKWSNVSDLWGRRRGRLFASGADEVEYCRLYKKVVDVAAFHNGEACRELHYRREK